MIPGMERVIVSCFCRKLLLWVRYVYAEPSRKGKSLCWDLIVCTAGASLRVDVPISQDYSTERVPV